MKNSRLAQRKLGLNKPKTKKKFSLKIFIILISIFLVFIFLGFLILEFFSNWDGKSKLALTSQKANGDVNLIILDPSNPSITQISIPASTQVSAANDLGTWKLGSITKLGQNQNLGGDFLKRTIIKSFNFPIDDWGGEDLIGLTSGNLISEISSLIHGNKSSLSVVDKLKIASFSLGIGISDRFSLDLQNTNYLSRSQLPDGSLGWKITGSSSPTLISYFAIPNFSKNNYAIVVNKGSSNEEVSVVSNVIEFLGMKVSSVQSQKPGGESCKITGQDRKVVQKLSQIFSCITNFSKPDNNFDIQIDLGLKKSL